MSWPEILSDAWPRARMEHACWLCGRRIDAGENYRRSVLKIDDDLWTSKECRHCVEMVTLTTATEWADDGYGPDTIADWEPETIWEARVKAHWKRGWRRRDGGLYPVPIGGDA